MTQPAESQPPPGDTSGDDFRWQSAFQRSGDPLFLLSPRRRIAFVNRAWEALTGLSAREARGMVCRRRPPDPAAPWPELVQNALAPPADVRAGHTAQVRRLLPAARTRNEPQWWSITFFPLGGDDAPILGRVSVVVSEGLFANPPLPEKIVALRERRVAEYRLERLQSDLPTMQRVTEQVRLAAGTRVPVLLCGEPGTGKHWIARLIHQQSPEKNKAFLRLSCARLPAAVVPGLPGSVRLPSVGTLYLDEVSCLPREVQDRLARWLSSREESAPRVLAGLGTDPNQDLQAGRLLPALHGILSPLVISLPPLRERLADLPHLAASMLQRAALAADHAVTSVSSETMDLFRGYRWPGNLRELYQVLVSGCARAKTERLEVDDLPFYVRSNPPPAERVLVLDSLLEQVERRLIMLALRMAQNNKSRAAELLSIWRPRLLRRMEMLGIKEE